MAGKYYYEGHRDGKLYKGTIISINRKTALDSMSKLMGFNWTEADSFKAWDEAGSEDPFCMHNGEAKPRVRADSSPSGLTVVKSPEGDMSVVRTMGPAPSPSPPPPPPRDVGSIKPANFFKLKEA